MKSIQKKMKPGQIQQFRRELVSWFECNGRSLPWRETKDPYKIWVSEVMLQQTRVITVLDYYPDFIKRFPGVRELAEADTGEVLKYWEGLGYYARARNLHRAAVLIEDELNGNIPSDYKTIRGLPGVGDYIATAVLSLAFDLPHAVVDGNVKRVLSRLFLIDSPIGSSRSRTIFKERIQDLLDPERSGLFNQAMMELGALICHPRQPECPGCPVNLFCQAFRMERQEKYPVPGVKKEIPQHHVVAGVIYNKDRFLITNRKPSGLLGGLWEFPGGKVEDGESPEAALRREIKEEVGLSIQIEAQLARVHHAYSHFRIIMDVFSCRYQSGEVVLKSPVDYRWITVRDIDDYPFPGANHKFIPLLRNKR
jgi:A/G-specific adenine glycosylase